MRDAADVARVLALVAAGRSTAAIARETGIPFNTVRNWRSGRVPTRPARVIDPVAHLAPVRESYAYLLGLYLGDGHIASHRRDVLRLVIYLDARYPALAGRCEAAMEDVLPFNCVHRLRRGGCVRISAYSKSLATLFPQHGPGPKHRRPIELEPWQLEITHEHPRRFLEGLIHSDGTRAVNTIRGGRRTYRYSRYQFSNRSAEIRALFCHHCDLVGIEWRVMNAVTISVARRASVELMDSFIQPKAAAARRGGAGASRRR